MSRDQWSRRRFIQGLGAVVWLPYLESLSPLWGVANAAGPAKKRFFALFWPGGVGGNKGDNGRFHFGSGGYLSSLNDIKSNIIIPRGFSYGEQVNGSGLPLLDGSRYPYDFPDLTHGAGTCYFLTGWGQKDKTHLHRAPLGTKSLDQMIADNIQSSAEKVPIHSFVTGLTQSQPSLAAMFGVAGRTVSWSRADSPVSPMYSLQSMFNKFFNIVQSSTTEESYQNRKRSILDFALSDISSLKNEVNAEDRVKLDTYFEQVREIEQSIGNTQGYTCNQLTSNLVSGEPNLGDINASFAHLRKIIDLHVVVHQCDMARVSTLMMDNSVGALGGGGVTNAYHVHTDAEHEGATYRNIIQGHIDTVGYAIRKFKAAGLLNDTVILGGSDCKAGHTSINNPYIIAGSGTGYKWGTEIGSLSSIRPGSDLLVDIGRSFGLNINSMGDAMNSSFLRNGYYFNKTAAVANRRGEGNSGILT